MDYPDLAAEIADLFLRLEGVQWTICIGLYENELYVSVRARQEDADAKVLARQSIGESGSAGGRNTLAGGQIPLNGRDPETLAADVRHRALDFLDIPSSSGGEPLLT
jgi:hypothetical protein